MGQALRLRRDFSDISLRNQIPVRRKGVVKMRNLFVGIGVRPGIGISTVLRFAEEGSLAAELIREPVILLKMDTGHVNGIRAPGA
jgi:hypothetical protein